MEVGSAEDLEDWFKTLSEEQYRGQALLIRVPAGEYSLTTMLSLDQLAGVASLSILGDPSGGGTTLVAAPGSTLLATSPGAPPLKPPCVPLLHAFARLVEFHVALALQHHFTCA